MRLQVCGETMAGHALFRLTEANRGDAATRRQQQHRTNETDQQNMPFADCAQ